MTNVFIFHGTGGHPEENWFPWLKKKLEALGCRVIIPQFPTPKNQTPRKWFVVLKKYEKYINRHTIFVGHSLGGTFALRILEKLRAPIRAAYFVASPIGIMPIKNYKTDKPFVDQPFDFEKIKKNCKTFTVFHADNDPFVSIKNGKNLAKNLGTELIRVHGAGHFNTAAGYTRFDLLFTKIKKLLTITTKAKNERVEPLKGVC